MKPSFVDHSREVFQRSEFRSKKNTDRRYFDRTPITLAHFPLISRQVQFILNIPRPRNSVIIIPFIRAIIIPLDSGWKGTHHPSFSLFFFQFWVKQSESCSPNRVANSKLYRAEINIACSSSGLLRDERASTKNFIPIEFLHAPSNRTSVRKPVVIVRSL